MENHHNPSPFMSSATERYSKKTHFTLSKFQHSTQMNANKNSIANDYTKGSFYLCHQLQKNTKILEFYHLFSGTKIRKLSPKM